VLGIVQAEFAADRIGGVAWRLAVEVVEECRQEQRAEDKPAPVAVKKRCEKEA
jgi:hypothetical protein